MTLELTSESDSVGLSGYPQSTDLVWLGAPVDSGETRDLELSL